MKTLPAVVVAAVSLLVTGVVSAQNGYMMNGSGWMGGYGGIWGPLVLIAVVVGVVVFVMKGKGE